MCLRGADGPRGSPAPTVSIVVVWSSLIAVIVALTDSKHAVPVDREPPSVHQNPYGSSAPDISRGPSIQAPGPWTAAGLRY
jgi:hypothetical protein